MHLRISSLQPQWLALYSNRTALVVPLLAVPVCSACLLSGSQKSGYTSSLSRPISVPYQ